MTERQDLNRYAIQSVVLAIVAFLQFQIAAAANDDLEDPRKPATRLYEFVYGAEVSDLEPGADIKVWFPVPFDNHFQKIDMVSTEIPGVLHINTGHQYGNKIGFFATAVPKTGRLAFTMKYRVERREARQDGSSIDGATKEKFLRQNRLVPVSGKPLELIQNTVFDSNPTKVGHQLYDIVEQYMTYDKTKPGYGNGDVLWACSSKIGNCTDFHSLFISLARSQGIPARFEIGFPLPSDQNKGTVKGYHCWAWFHDKETGWVPVDISEADKHPDLKSYYFGRLTPDRVAFSTGRDIELFPKSMSPQLNYFIHPHVEVAGEQVENAMMKFDFSFADIDPTETTSK